MIVGEADHLIIAFRLIDRADPILKECKRLLTSLGSRAVRFRGPAGRPLFKIGFKTGMPRRIRVDPKRGPEFGTGAICQTAPLPGFFVPLSPHRVHMSCVLVVALLRGETH